MTAMNVMGSDEHQECECFNACAVREKSDAAPFGKSRDVIMTDQQRHQQVLHGTACALLVRCALCSTIEVDASAHVLQHRMCAHRAMLRGMSAGL